ncbi:hypothetical protein [Aquabacterium sp.]|uniref:hypothetical protein n=1 Tax=Aquabacterium sp. TaxID=1872578 RepID=UPI0035B0B221
MGAALFAMPPDVLPLSARSGWLDPDAVDASTAPKSPERLLAELLQGTDARGRAPYGLPLPASSALVHLGSCTANPITPAMLARHQALSARLHEHPDWRDPQQALREMFGAAQCKLAASGTDAEYTVALAMGGAPYCSILIDPNEVGSGCARAASGLPHTPGCPVDTPLAVHATIESPLLRDAAGRMLPQGAVDQQVFDIATRHARQPLLLHHVPCSKTGLSAPSEAACLSIQQSHPAGARVVVDASQGRGSVQDVRRWLGYGWAVILTGSKYLGAPPFAGATLLPEGWPPAQGFAAGPGLRARWRLALQALAGPQPDGAPWDAAVAGFASQLPPGALDMCPDADAACRQGIFSFDLGLDLDATRALHRRLIARGFFIGQPVIAGPRALLRVALGVRTPLGRAADDLQQLARTIRHELQHG